MPPPETIWRARDAVSRESSDVAIQPASTDPIPVRFRVGLHPRPVAIGGHSDEPAVRQRSARSRAEIEDHLRRREQEQISARDYRMRRRVLRLRSRWLARYFSSERHPFRNRLETVRRSGEQAL